MAETIPYDPSRDTIDQLVGLSAGQSLYAIRHQRDKVAAATQGSEDALFDPTLPGLTLVERLLVALLACKLTPASELANYYQQKLVHAGADKATVEIVLAGKINEIKNGRLNAILKFTHTLITDPIKGDKAALQALPAAGVSTPEVVALSQLIAFLSYQVRLAAGLKAMKALEASV